MKSYFARRFSMLFLGCIVACSFLCPAMNNKRRLLIIVLSVTMGSVLALLLIRSRMGNLGPQAWQQIGINFVFALVIVVVIGLLLRKKNDKM